ncbi:MAG: ABC transporter permease [Phycisphaeraceae bacterium]|nr:ABC transporter permease [Phycisphaeraceae bacterium]
MRFLPTSYAVRNLGRSTPRLALSVLGSGLVVLLVLGAGGFVRGMTESLRRAGDSGNVLIMGIGSEESIERSEIPASTAALLQASVPGLRSEGGAAFVSPEVHVQLPVSVARDTPEGRLILVRGVTPAALLVHGQVQIAEGEWPRSGHDEVLVGRLAHTKLGVPPDSLAVGQTLRIDGRDRHISGHLAAPQSLIDAEIWMPLNDLKETTKRVTDSCVVATLADGPDGAELADVQTFCRRRLDLEITAMSESAYYSRLAAFFAPIRIVVWVTAVLIAAGGVLGGLNTMYAAFASRVREIGMLRCLGFRRSAVIVSLVQESCLACATGALIACAIGVFFLDGLAVQFSMGAFGLRIDAPALLFALSIGLCLGLLGALPPAYRCLKLPIPESLKAV